VTNIKEKGEMVREGSWKIETASILDFAVIVAPP
jgi:hypothetical protein